MENRFYLHRERGQAIITATIFFLAATLTILGGVARPLLQDSQNIRQVVDSKQSYLFAEGGVEDVAYRIAKGRPVSSEEVLSEGTSYAATTTTADVSGKKEVSARGDSRNAIRTIKATLVIGQGVSFNFGLQAGEGGVNLKNSSSIAGNVFSNGPITGKNSNSVTGDVISAGPTGLIRDINIGGSAYANTIQNSTIGGNAYYQSISGSTVGGTLNPGSANQAPSSLPITDAMISAWEVDAAAGGTIITCPYDINSDVTLGPVKIDCDMKVTGNAVITLTGNVWVKGNIDIKNSVTVRADASLGNTSVVVIADNPANRLSSSKIKIRNSATFLGNGQPQSYILFVSQNNSAQMGGGGEAIGVKNSAQGNLLIYAGHGKVEVENSVSLKEVTGWKVEAENAAQIVYESGLANLLFTSGPAGGFSISGWGEI